MQGNHRCPRGVHEMRRPDSFPNVRVEIRPIPCSCFQPGFYKLCCQPTVVKTRTPLEVAALPHVKQVKEREMENTFEYSTTFVGLPCDR